MIRVTAKGEGWIWELIDFNGRALVYSQEVYPDDKSAFRAALQYRKSFWALACEIDHRMGACI